MKATFLGRPVTVFKIEDNQALISTGEHDRVYVKASDLAIEPEEPKEPEKPEEPQKDETEEPETEPPITDATDITDLMENAVKKSRRKSNEAQSS